MKLASLAIVVLAAGAMGACGSGHAGGADAGGTSGGGGAAGTLGGSGGASAGRGGAGGASGSGGTMAPSNDAASDASEGGCPATPPADRSACPVLNCMSPPGQIPRYGPECSYGSLRCACSITGTSGGCVCPAGQTCQAPWPAIWVCATDGG